MNAFTIKDLENLSGIKAHTIRIWEQRYSFLKPQRTETNIRLYSNEELKMILNIALLNRYGFKISHIDRMDESEIREKILSLNSGEAQTERIINDLITRMIDLDGEGFEKILNTHIRTKRIDITLNQIIFPFLEKVGILWQTGHINPGQEHLVSAIIRRKLIVGVDQAESRLPSDKTFFLFLPEGEHHELGLLYVQYLLKSHGLNVIYLGANVPVKDAEFVANIRKPDYIYIHLTSMAPSFNFDKFLQQLGTRFRHIPAIISGAVARQYKKPLPPNVLLKTSLSEVQEFFASLH